MDIKLGPPVVLMWKCLTGISGHAAKILLNIQLDASLCPVRPLMVLCDKLLRIVPHWLQRIVLGSIPVPSDIVLPFLALALQSEYFFHIVFRLRLCFGCYLF